MSITSDELNFLVYRYLQESGFVHSAFVFAYESLVGRANLATADIPPGALINFLQKGLQLVEIEKELEQNSAGGDIRNGLSVLAGTNAAGIPETDSSEAMEIESGPTKKGAGGPGANAANATGGSREQEKTTLDLQGKAKSQSDSVDSTLISLADVTELKGHKADVLTCAWNPKCDVLASGSSDSTVRMWTIPRGASGLPAGNAASAEPKVLNHKHSDSDMGSVPPKDVTTLDWHPDGQLLATGSFYGNARIWTLDGKEQHVLKSHKASIVAMKWNKSGKYLLTGSLDTTAVLWDGSTGKELQVCTSHKSPILGVDWRDGETFATCSTDNTIHIYKVGTKEVLQVLKGHTNEINTISWNPSGTLLASCSDDSTAKIWKSDLSELAFDLTEHTQEVYQVKWSPLTARNILATASFDTSIKIWDADTGKCLLTLSGHTQSVYSVAFSPNGKYLASGSMDHTVRIWELEEGKCVRRFKGGGGVFEVRWNRDGDKVASCFGVPARSVCVIDFHM